MRRPCLQLRRGGGRRTATARPAARRRRASATTTSSNRPPGWPRPATAASGTTATRTRRRSPPTVARVPRGADRLRRGLHVRGLRRRQSGRRPRGPRPPGGARSPNGLGLPDSRAAAIAGAFERAVDAANAAVIANTESRQPERRGGDLRRCRAGGQPLRVRQRRRQPGLLDPRPGGRRAVAAVARRLGGAAADRLRRSREEAERGPQAHAITKWLGRDSPDHKPANRLGHADRPGLAAGLLRRAVELRLRAGSPAGPDQPADAVPSAPVP